MKNNNIEESHDGYFKHIKSVAKQNEENAKEGRLKISDLMDSIQEDGSIRATDYGYTIGNEKFDRGIDDLFPMTGGLEEIRYDTEPSEEFRARFKRSVKSEQYGDNSKLANVSKEWSNPRSNIDVGDSIIDKVKSIATEYSKEKDEWFLYGDSLERGTRKLNRTSRFGVKESVTNKNNINNKDMINESNIVRSFIEGKSSEGNELATDGTSLFHYNNEIAKIEEGQLFVTNNGFKSESVFNTLQTLPLINLTEKDGKWFLNGEQWDGNWAIVENKQRNETSQTIKRLTFQNNFLSEQDMMNRIPEKFQQEGMIFEMYDGDNLYRLSWTHKPNIIKESSTLKMKAELNEMSSFFQNKLYRANDKYSQKGEEKMFNEILNKMRGGKVQKKFKASIISEKMEDGAAKTQILNELSDTPITNSSSTTRKMKFVDDVVEPLNEDLQQKLDLYSDDEKKRMLTDLKLYNVFHFVSEDPPSGFVDKVIKGAINKGQVSKEDVLSWLDRN